MNPIEGRFSDLGAIGSPLPQGPVSASPPSTPAATSDSGASGSDSSSSPAASGRRGLAALAVVAIVVAALSVVLLRWRQPASRGELRVSSDAALPATGGRPEGEEVDDGGLPARPEEEATDALFTPLGAIEAALRGGR